MIEHGFDIAARGPHELVSVPVGTRVIVPSDWAYSWLKGVVIEEERQSTWGGGGKTIFAFVRVEFDQACLDAMPEWQRQRYESICAGTPQKKDRRWLAACDVCVLNTHEDGYFRCIARTATGERLIEYRPLSRAA